MSKGTPQQFLAALPWSTKLLWQGKSSTIILDEERRATLTFKTRGVAEHYTGILVEITSKTHGAIKSKFFDFDEYMHERIDNRADYPLRGNERRFEVIAYIGWHWYICIPKHPEYFTQAIEEWIDYWR